MKEIECLSQRSIYRHPLAVERRRVLWLENMNNMYMNALIAVGVVASMLTGVLLAVASAANML